MKAKAWMNNKSSAHICFDVGTIFIFFSMKKLLVLLSFIIIGCDRSPPILPADHPNVKLAYVEWKGRDVVKTYSRLFTDKTELIGESEVRQEGNKYLYVYRLSTNNTSKARWEILDCINKKPIIYNMEKDKDIIVFHRSESPPVYVYRMATCFEGEKKNEIVFYTIIPHKMRSSRDPKD